MANVLTSNPVFIDTASGSDLTGMRRIQQIQWIKSDNGFADNDSLVMTINGVEITARYNQGSDVGQQDCVVYQAGPFANPISVINFVVSTIDQGVVLIWLA